MRRLPLLLTLLALLGTTCSHKAAPVRHTLTITARGTCETGMYGAPSGTFYGGGSEDVQVRDPSNQLIGAATMHVASGFQDPSLAPGDCAGMVRIPSLPDVSLYQLKLGTVPGVVTFHLAQLRRDRWRVSLSSDG